jgi:protein O-mannosyl-transferase
MSLFDLESETRLSPCRRNAFAFFALFVILLMTYSNTFKASWHFDDYANILNRESLHLRELTWENITQTFFENLEEKRRLYRPAPCFSLALNYYFGQENVFGYHLVNLSIHFIASIFLFLFIYQVLNLPRLRQRYGQYAYFLALLATVLWAINPIQTQAVTYIVQRMASMAGMFFIMSMYFYVKGRISERISFRIIHYFACSVTAVLSFFSKENAALLPISLFLLDLYLIQGFERGNILKNLYVLSAVLSLFVIVALILRGPSIFSLNHLIASYEGREYTLLERLLTQPRVLLLYLSLVFYPMPHRLSITHDISISKSLFDPPSTILAILCTLLVLAVASAKSKRWPLTSYCILFFFINHLIESSVFPLELVFEHRNYIPSMLLFLPISILMLEGLRFYSHKKSMMALLFAFYALTLIVLGHSTFVRNFVWKTEESLWLNAIEKSPNLTRPYHNLGTHYGRHLGDRRKEIAYCLQALKVGKGSHGETRHITHYNLGLAYAAVGQEETAIEHFRKAIEIYPQYSKAHNDLAALLIRQKEYDKAFGHLIQALTYDEKNPHAHLHLGFVLLKQRRLDEAKWELEKALAIKSDFLPALYNLVE